MAIVGPEFVLGFAVGYFENVYGSVAACKHLGIDRLM